MPKADGTDHRFGEAQEDHLTSAISDERALARFASRYVHRDPVRSSDDLDLDIWRHPALLNLAADLLRDRLARALFATTEEMSWRNVGCHRLPNSRLSFKSGRWRYGPIKRYKSYLPLVGIVAHRGPRHVARSGEQDCLLLIGIER